MVADDASQHLSTVPKRTNRRRSAFTVLLRIGVRCKIPCLPFVCHQMESMPARRSRYTPNQFWERMGCFGTAPVLCEYFRLTVVEHSSAKFQNTLINGRLRDRRRRTESLKTETTCVSSLKCIDTSVAEKSKLSMLLYFNLHVKFQLEFQLCFSSA